jgi:hypothetical protein
VGTKVRHTDRTHIDVMSHAGQPLGALMQRQLIAPKVDIDPPTLFAVAGLAAQYFGVEGYSGLKVPCWNR